MVTYKINLKNPFSQRKTFIVRIYGGQEKINLAPGESRDLTTLHPGFTVQATSPTDPAAQIKISQDFMSGGGALQIMLRDHFNRTSREVQVHRRPSSEFFTLTA